MLMVEKPGAPHFDVVAGGVKEGNGAPSAAFTCLCRREVLDC